MKLKTVSLDSLKPKAAEYLPLQKVTLCQAICSWWLLWILPVAVVIGYVSSLPMQRILMLCGIGADAAAYGAITLLFLLVALVSAYCVAWLLTCRRNKREAKEKGMLPSQSEWGGGIFWVVLALITFLALEGPAQGRLYSTARAYGHLPVMRIAAPLVWDGDQRRALFTRELESGDGEAQMLWYGHLDLSGNMARMMAVRALYCRQFRSAEWLWGQAPQEKDSGWNFVALSAALSVNAPADLMMRFADECGDKIVAYAAAVLNHADDDILRSLVQRSQALKEKLADAKYAAFLRDVRHLDPETLQPLPDTHEN